MAGTKGYVLVLPNEAARQLSKDKICLVMKLRSNDYPELKSELNRFLNSTKWTPEIQMGQELPAHSFYMVKPYYRRDLCYCMVW